MTDPQALADAIAAGATIDDLKRDWPDVTIDDLKAAQKAAGELTPRRLRGDDRQE